MMIRFLENNPKNGVNTEHAASLFYTVFSRHVIFSKNLENLKQNNPFFYLNFNQNSKNETQKKQ